MKKENKTWEERNERAGKRVHLLLYGDETEEDPRYLEWRNDLEVAILDWNRITEERGVEKEKDKVREWVEKMREDMEYIGIDEAVERLIEKLGHKIDR